MSQVFSFFYLSFIRAAGRSSDNATGMTKYHSRYMNMHWFVRFAASISLEETRAETFDLNAGTSVLLDMLYKHPLELQRQAFHDSAEQRSRTCGPTTLARTLKLRSDSKLIGIFSSSHLRYYSIGW